MGDDQCAVFLVNDQCLSEALSSHAGSDRMDHPNLLLRHDPSVLLPYDPQGWFTISKWHVRVAMFSSGGYALLVFCFLFAGVSCGYQQLRPFLFVYLLLCFVSLYSFATHGGVTSFTEISYSISMGFFLYYLRYHR
ncbi:MAG: hypothetical protein ACLVJ6_00615 [Merdibacter sp.]